MVQLLSVLFWILSSLSVNGCSVTETQVPSNMNSSPKMLDSTASAINSALATLAMNSTAPAADYRIGPEDLLQITLFNITDAETQLTPRNSNVRVSQQGLISFPLLGDIKAAGLTPSELEQELRKHYDNYIHNPQVAVMVAEYRQRVSVIGAVQKPGLFELSGPKTVVDILASAGGVSERAGTQVHIYRQGTNGRESHVVDLEVLSGSTGLINAGNVPMVNMAVQSGDIINVPQAGMYFVDGAVNRPGSYSLGRQFTLTQALATAGGVNVELNSNSISIYRRKGIGNVEIVEVDFDDLKAGSIPDPQVRPEDVIFVPMSTAKYIVRRFVGTLVGGMSIGQVIPRP
jgi:polysaccharide export outer membrane protein